MTCSARTIVKSACSAPPMVTKASSATASDMLQMVRAPMMSAPFSNASACLRNGRPEGLFLRGYRSALVWRDDRRQIRRMVRGVGPAEHGARLTELLDHAPMDALVDMLLIGVCGIEKRPVLDRIGRQNHPVMREGFIDDPALRGIVNLSVHIGGLGRRLHGHRIEGETRQRLHSRDHPDQGFVRKTAVRIPAADIAVNPGKPGLLDMAPWRRPFGRGPECRHKRATMLVDADGVEADIDVFAKLGVVEAEDFERNIARQRSKADAGRNSVRTDGIEHRHAFDGPVRVKVVARSRRVKAVDGLLVARTGGFCTGSNRRIDAVMVPGDIEPLLAELTLNSRCANQSGQGTG